MNILAPKLRNHITWLFVLVFVFAVQSCKKSPADDVKIQFNTNIFKSPTSIVVGNINADGSIPSSVSIKFLGGQASLVKDVMGGKNFKVNDGLLNIVLDRTANPSTSNPIEVKAIITSPGFAPYHIDLKFTNPDENYFYSVKLLEYAKPANAISTAVKEETLVSGKSSSNITITTNPTATQPFMAKVFIPANTIFYDANGKAITGNKLAVNVAYTTPNANGVINNAFFGSMNSAVDQNDKIIPKGLEFISLAGASIKMTIGTTQVKSFSKPVTVEYEISSNVTNPSTKKPFAEGDEFSTVSKDDETGVWKSESTKVKVTKNASNKLMLKYDINHLSTQTAGSFYLGSTGFSSTEVELKVSRDSDVGDDLFDVTFNLKSIGTILIKDGELSQTKKFTITISEYGEIEYGLFVNNINGELFLNNLRSFTKINFNLASQNKHAEFEQKNKLSYIDFIPSVECTNKYYIFRPDFTAQLYNHTTKTTTYIFSSSVIRGVKLIDGDRYTVSAQFEGKNYSASFVSGTDGISLENSDGIELKYKGFDASNSKRMDMNKKMDYSITARIKIKCK